MKITIELETHPNCSEEDAKRIVEELVCDLSSREMKDIVGDPDDGHYVAYPPFSSVSCRYE